MASKSCPKCGKNVYQTEKVDISGNWFHKGCFKCSDAECDIQLNLKTFQFLENKLWCNKHVPKHQAAQVADDLSLLHALHAPKKETEGLHKISVGTGESFSYGAESIALIHAMNAPKKVTEGLHKTKVGTSDTNAYGIDAVETQRALNAPKKASENLGYVLKGAH